MTTTYKCPKCNGSGYLSCYAGIAGGVCFSCSGNGLKVGKPPVPGIRFLVTAIDKDTGDRLNVFYIKAKNAEQATEKAIAQLSRGNGYIPDSAQVLA